VGLVGVHGEGIAGCVPEAAMVAAVDAAAVVVDRMIVELPLFGEALVATHEEALVRGGHVDDLFALRENLQSFCVEMLNDGKNDGCIVRASGFEQS
jgi:hypothetical protein